MIPGQAQQFFEAAAAQSGGGGGGLQVNRSLRFNSDDSAYLNRTPSSATNRKTFTLSAWIKAPDVANSQQIILSSSSGSTPYTSIDFRDNNLRIIEWNGSSVTFQVKTNALLRDVSAWYHVVFAVDTTQSTAADRVKIYVNGVQETSFATANYPSLNHDTHINNNQLHYIGDNAATSYTGPLDGYLADVNFIDGQALAPTEFGSTDSDNNWNPKEYSGGSYGTNGFYLKFADNSNNAALGTDSSGNNNTWTVNNLVADITSSTNSAMSAVTYTGNGSSNSITGVGFKPDFVWLKGRSQTNVSHQLYDVVRGTSQMLQCDNTTPESTVSGVTSFDTDGFTIGSNGGTNNNSSTYIAWAWKAGGSASSNTDGTITSSVSVNTSYGFSIVSYTGNGSDATIGHGLGSTPKWIIKKFRSTTSSWDVYHESVGAGKRLVLNTTADEASTSSYQNVNSSTFDVHAGNNDNGATAIAYCWSEVPSFSSFGSYTGNGSTSGPTITTGFKPRFILLKASTINGEDWVIMDTARSPSNPSNLLISPNNDSQEYSNSAYNTDFNDDGFQIKNTNPRWNTNGETYIYAAFAEKPDQSVIDSLIDTPTNYEADTGNNGGNYATLNPATAFADPLVLSNGNLDAEATGTPGAGNWKGAVSTFGFDSGKWYAEFTVAAFSGSNHINIGINPLNKQSTPLQSGSDGGHYYNITGSLWNANSYGGSYGAAVVGDIIGVAVDMDTNDDIKFYKNGSLLATVSLNSNITTNGFQFALGNYTTSKVNCNFGQRPFAHPVSGYKSVCTQNLTDPTIADGSTAMDVKLWTGDGSSTRTISNYSFSPDFVWIKNRTTAGWQHVLYDQIRGGGTGSVTKSLSSDSTRSEASGNDTNHGYLSGFTSDGYTLVKGSQATGDYVNFNSWAYVGWAWDAGTSTVSNTDGSITSNVRANQSVGCSVVSYTGTGSNATVGHGLNAAPHMYIVKNRSNTYEWGVYHISIGTGAAQVLNAANNNSTSNTWWNNTAPTSSVFSIGTYGAVNQNTSDFIAYCFAPVVGFSAFGIYDGNSSDDGPFVFTGFRVKWVIIKCTNAAGQEWVMLDAVRNSYNVVDNALYANNTDAEATGSTRKADFLSNGFKLRDGSSGATNLSGRTYVYAAFAEHPFKTARAR